MLDVFAKVTQFWKRGEPYVFLEIEPRAVRATFFRILSEQKLIQIEGQWEWRDSYLVSLPLCTQFLEKNYRSVPIILQGDSHLVTSTYSAIAVTRENPLAIINESDLEHTVGQAVLRLFDRERSRIGAKMEVSEVEVVLLDARSRQLLLDGHRVANPLGFKAKHIELELLETCVTRELFQLLQKQPCFSRIVFISESVTAIAHALAQQSNQEIFVAMVLPQETRVAAASGAHALHVDSFSWGNQNLFAALQELFGLDAEVGQAFLDRYSRGEVSAAVSRRFEQVLSPELQFFIRGVSAVIPVSSAVVYVGGEVLPNFIFLPRFQERFPKTLRLLPLSTDKISKYLDFTLEWKQSSRVNNSWPLAASIFEMQAYSKDTVVNQICTRRARWLHI